MSGPAGAWAVGTVPASSSSAAGSGWADAVAVLLAAVSWVTDNAEFADQASDHDPQVVRFVPGAGR
jgi:hypothetical protein